MTTSQMNGADLALTPLGAGDLIDRSVRFYRKNFWTFILVASPPVIAGTIFSVGWMILGRSLFKVSGAEPAEAIFYTLFLRLGDLIIWTVQLVGMLIVMGGASRNFVRHLLFGEPMTFRETYRNIRGRLAGLTGVSFLLAFFLGIVAFFVFYAGAVAAILGASVIMIFFQSIPYAAVTLTVAVVLIALGTALWLFFLIASRFVYVPQVMLVEGRGAFGAIARSAGLAGKNVKRLAASPALLAIEIGRAHV